MATIANDAIVRYRAACDDAKEEISLLQDNDQGHGRSDQDVYSNTDADVVVAECIERLLAHASSEIIGSAGVAPKDKLFATTHLNAAPDALRKPETEIFGQIITSLVKLGFNAMRMAEVALQCAIEHPWGIAAIAIPLIILACTPAIPGAVGSTASGIAAGAAPGNRSPQMTC